MRRYRPVLGLVVAAMTTAVVTAPAPLPAASQAQTPPNHGEDVSGFVIAAVGDLVPHPNLASDANARAVKRLADSHHPDAYFLLGDLQYETGVLALYQSVYDPIWGDVKQDTYPTAGNHEYGNGMNSGWASTGGGYFDYYASRARPGSASYYWFYVNLPAGGRWLVVVLNSACGDYDNPPEWHTPLCTTDSAQASWLRSVLDANQQIRCIMAVFHEPRFATPAPVPGKPSMATLWNIMDNEGAARGVDLVLNGHNHAYERLKPMIFNGTIDHRRGIWSTIVGTGGRDLIPFRGRCIRHGPRPTTTISGSSNWCCAATAGHSRSSAPTAPPSTPKRSAATREHLGLTAVDARAGATDLDRPQRDQPLTASPSEGGAGGEQAARTLALADKQ